MQVEFYLGIFFLIFGIISLIGRIFKIKKMFWKLEPMKQFWGDRVGSIIHFIGYIVIPIVFGIFLIVQNRR